MTLSMSPPRWPMGERGAAAGSGAPRAVGAPAQPPLLSAKMASVAERAWVVLPVAQRADGSWIDDTLAARTAEAGLGARAPEAGQFPRQRVELYRGPDAADEVERAFRRRGWTDGLPIVVPTTGRVQELVRASGRAPHDVLGKMAPLGGLATVERVAANAVMAGGGVEQFPFVVAAVEAVCDPAFNLAGVQTTDENVDTYR